MASRHAWRGFAHEGDILRTAPRIGEILVRRRAITPEQLAYALSEQDRRGGRLGEVLVRLGYVQPAQLRQALTEQGRMLLMAASIFVGGAAGLGVVGHAVLNASMPQGLIVDDASLVGVALQVDGEVSVVDVNGSRRTIRTGDQLRKGDVLETAADAHVNLLLNDRSVLEVGPNSVVALDGFVYSNKRGDLTGKAALRLLASGVSGAMGMGMQQAALTGSTVTLGVRG